MKNRYYNKKNEAGFPVLIADMMAIRWLLAADI